MEDKIKESIVKILEDKIKTDRCNCKPYGLDAAAQRIIMEIILPIKVDLVEAQAKNRVYESALENSNFKAIVVKGSKNGGEK